MNRSPILQRNRSSIQVPHPPSQPPDIKIRREDRKEDRRGQRAGKDEGKLILLWKQHPGKLGGIWGGSERVFLLWG
jgi:hypothetical protein